MSAEDRLFYPATVRNREPILQVLRDVLPRQGTVLEIACGSGQHAAWIAPQLPALTWQPSDPELKCRRSVDAWSREAGATNLLPAIDLDVHATPWPLDAADAVVCINMIHIAPWSATGALLHGAARILAPGGPLYLYGPYRVNGEHTAPSNASFDASLTGRNPEWGVRDLDDVISAAEEHGLVFEEKVAMPANNLSVVLRRR